MDESHFGHERATHMEADSSSPSTIDSIEDSVIDSPCNTLSSEPAPAADGSNLDPDDSDHIGGPVWKFPSEGSNSLPGGHSSSAGREAVDLPVAVAYPRKCRRCQRAWVSSYVNERHHWKLCTPDPSVANAPKKDTPSCWGIPRRVWCEVNAALTRIQWRDDRDAESADGSIAFHEIQDVTLLQEPHESFQVTSRAGRRVVFQCRHDSGGENTSSATGARALDARQWTEYLDMFRRFAQDQDELNDEDKAVRPKEKLLPSIHENPQEETLQEIQRVMAANDVEALQEILDDTELAASARVLTDHNGSSLLLQAIQMDADRRVVQTLLHAGVDCNAKNHDGESPLILAAASGDIELLRMLSEAPGIRANQRYALGATALHAAANAGDVHMLRLLCERSEVVTTLVDENGWTALHYAAASANGRNAMAFLCEFLPDLVDAQCIQGNTPLHVAAGCGREQNLRVLLETAANPHVVNRDGHTAYHVALHNHNIACGMAVHEYMVTPRAAYERIGMTVVANATKEDRVACVETTGGQAYYHDYGDNDPLTDGVDQAPSQWTEYYSEDQIPYYYNAFTGESTWHKPELKTLRPPPPPPRTNNHTTATSTDGDPDDQKLPLCMIPLVSPLVSLDDPTAATKLDSRRKKDRALRRSQKLRHRNHETYNTQGTMLPPPPPVKHSLAQHER